MLISELCEKLGWDDKKEKQRLGYILRGKAMRLKTKHTRSGQVLNFSNPRTRRKLTYLYTRYGIIENNGLFQDKKDVKKTSVETLKGIGTEKAKEHIQRVNEIRDYVMKNEGGASIVALNDNFNPMDISKLIESGQLIKAPKSNSYIWYEK